MTDAVTVVAITASNALMVIVLNNIFAARKDTRDARLRQTEKAEDYARQDLVAARVAAAAEQTATAARLLVNSNADQNARGDEVARLAAESNSTIQSQLKAIHGLVNSDMTDARTNERDQTKLTLIALHRVQALSEKLGLLVSQADLDTIKAIEERIVELDLILAARLVAQHQVDADNLKGPTP